MRRHLALLSVGVLCAAPALPFGRIVLAAGPAHVMIVRLPTPSCSDENHNLHPIRIKSG